MCSLRNGLSWREASQKAGQINKDKKKKRIEKYNLNPSKCKYCQNYIPYNKRKNKFCSHSCAASFNNQGVERNKTHGLFKKKKCINCGLITDNKKYCNIRCNSEHLKKVRRIWIEGNNCLKDYKKDKWYLEEIRGKKCEVCHNSEWMGTEIPLDIDHIDGDSDNNILDNLRLICPNCHRQTPTYGSKNRGKGRYSKRQKYRKNRYDSRLSY